MTDTNPPKYIQEEFEQELKALLEKHKIKLKAIALHDSYYNETRVDIYFEHNGFYKFEWNYDYEY